jgi:5-methylcytosine-specific restriction protein A
LASGGPDTPENTAALCPNCHRSLHYGSDRDALTADLIARILTAEAAHRGDAG